MSAPLGVNDVSWLFPGPKNAHDLVNFIRAADLTAPDPKDPSKREPIWPAAAFKQFIDNANGPAAKIGDNHQLKLPLDALNIKSWRIVALRIDPGAPGLTPEIQAQFGQQPQLRFILQPVSVSNGAVTVHDVTAHLIYSFTSEGLDPPAQPGCLGRSKPDLEAFKSVAKDFAMLRDGLREGRFGGVKIETNGKLLGVHPGLANRLSAKPLRDALVSVLERHLSGARLTGMAVMGLADGGPEPWVFLAMVPGPNGFAPLHGPTLNGSEFAQGLAVIDTPQVVPTPATNNLNPITCKNAILGPTALPVDERKGLATAALFDMGDNVLKKPEDIAKVKRTTDLIADAARSHFFNTDCVSCHTDTRRTMELLGAKTIPGVDPAVLPRDKWNVRNFGWFPSVNKPGTVEATATRRTAAESEAVVEFINKNSLAKP